MIRALTNQRQVFKFCWSQSWSRDTLFIKLRLYSCLYGTYLSVCLGHLCTAIVPLSTYLSGGNVCVAGVNNVRYWLRTYASMYTFKLGLADYISGRTNQNQCRVASFPLYKKGDKVHFFIYYYLYFVNTKMKLVVSVYLVQKMIKLWIFLPVWASSDHCFSSDIWVLKTFALSFYRSKMVLD